MAVRSELDIILDLEDNASSGLGRASNKASKFGDIASGVALGGVALLGAALVGVGAHAVTMALDIEDASAKARTQLGLTGAEAADFEDTMQAIFANNFGEDFDDIGAALATVDKQFQRVGGIDNQMQLQRVTEQAFGIRDAFGKDVNETVAASVALMDDFGLTSDEAMDFIVRGFQRGLDSSGDFLDSITEYSTQFGNAGSDASEFFSIMESGLQGGVLGTDKVADLMKEFQLIFLEGTDDQRAAFDELGLSYDQLIAQVNAGELTITDVFQMVVDELGNVESAQDQQRLGVELMGTQFEDMGRDAVLALDSTRVGVEDLEGGVEDLDAQYDTTRANWESASRQMQTALIPVGDTLMDMGTRIMPFVVDYIENTATPAIVRWSDALATGVERWNEGLGFFGNAPTAEEMFLGGALVPPSSQAVADRNDLAVVNPLNTQGGGAQGGGSGGFGDVPGSQYTVNNNFYGNASATDVESGVTQSLRSVGATP